MLPIPVAQDIVLSHCPGPLEAETVSLAEVEGRITAESVTARDDLPPFPASIKVCHVPSAAAITCPALALLNWFTDLYILFK